MKTKLSVFIVFFILLAPLRVFAFVFDQWESGMDINTIYSIAKKNDIPLHKEGLISTNKRYNSLMCEEYRDTATAYYYPVNLLGEFAKVNLLLTPLGKKVYQVSIVWNKRQQGKKSEFTNDVKKTIEQKYGAAKKLNGNIFADEFFWSVNDGTQITIKSSHGDLSLIYEDKIMKDMLDKEQASIANQKKVKAHFTDESKF
ncbi:MAG: hypothetical protein PHZ02_13035 [Desulfocapsaceae bacterium]|nr:hypothetical protein [Desulfocapsaceae bacterium]